MKLIWNRFVSIGSKNFLKACDCSFCVTSIIYYEIKAEFNMTFHANTVEM